MSLILSVVALGAVTPMQSLSDDYLRQLWRDFPMAATQAGYHRDGVDRKLDDQSAVARARRVRVLHDFAKRLATATAATQDRQERADAALLHDQIALELLDLEEAQPFRRRCDAPLNALGEVLFQNVVTEYAPLDARAQDVEARLKATPRYLADVRASLDQNVEEFRGAAKDDGEGLIGYIEHEIPAAFAKSKHAAALAAAIKPAVASLRSYLQFVDGELAKRPKQSFRFGRALYEKRFGPYLQTDQTPDQVLAAAETRLAALHREMAALARKVLGSKAPAGDREAIAAALSELANDHAKPAELFATVRQQIADARAFLVEKKLLTLPKHDNLQVIETPPFLRAQLAVAAFQGAPPLTPSAGAFYYVTPIPADWPASKVEGKLRENNRWLLDLISVHEAMPGHYVQFERGNELEPEGRRVLRSVLASGSYVEGWAVYTQDLLVDAGYRGGDPRLKLTARKLEARTVANTILDIKLQAGDLSDADALKLMTVDAFQEQPEAEAKLRRAKLSVTQLCSYFVGSEAWKAVRAEAEKRPGFDLRTFHDRALGEGPVTLPTLRTLLAP
jgi:uncharacterized protein (DUF885 family)